MAELNWDLWKAECWNNLLFSCMKLKWLYLQIQALLPKFTHINQVKLNNVFLQPVLKAAVVISVFKKGLYAQRLLCFLPNIYIGLMTCPYKPCFTNRKSRISLLPRREIKDKSPFGLVCSLEGIRCLSNILVWYSGQFLLASLKA